MKLPVCKPSVLSYLHHADYLAIIETDPRARDYLVNHFLQLYSRQNHTEAAGAELVIDFYSNDGAYPRYPFIHIAWIKAATLKAMGGNVVEQACGALRTGCYVEALLDEYHVRGKSAFGRRPFPHQNLIYGFSEEQRCFLAQGFDDSKNYCSFVIDFDDFAAAMRDDLGMSLISRTDALEYNNSQPFSPELIVTCLEDFLEARCSFSSYRPAGSAFGVATYAVAVSKVEEANGRAIDIRAWCVFHEHKLKLLALHDYLTRERRCKFDPALARGLQRLADDFMAIRNYLLESSLADRMVKVAALRANLARVTEPERELVRALMEGVRRSAAPAGFLDKCRGLLPFNVGRAPP